jgi:DNA ligase-1
MKREFVMLAQKYDPAKHGHGSYYWSVKLDGMRAFWDGGITRGKQVPWCDETCTGLFSRYMKPIFAPSWWLDQLPKVPLDGELWLGPGKFQEVMSICRRHEPDQRWKQIKYCIIDWPGLDTIFDYGRYTSTITTCTFDHKIRTVLETWAREQAVPWSKSTPFQPDRYWAGESPKYPNLTIVEQQKWNPADKDEILNNLLEQGHEGIVLRKVGSIWLPERSHNLLKIKPWTDAEGRVIGCTYGRSTDKGSKLLGKMGALIVEWDNRRFQLSGFTDLERVLTCELGRARAEQIASSRPGEESIEGVYPVNFPIGSTVTFKYRELSNDGIPKEARYWRKR